MNGITKHYVAGIVILVIALIQSVSEPSSPIHLSRGAITLLLGVSGALKIVFGAIDFPDTAEAHD